MTESSDERPALPVRLNDSTSIPLRWVVGLGVVLVSAGATLFSSYTWLDGRFDGLDRRLDGIERRTEDPWTRSDMRHWANALRAENKEAVNVPGVEPGREGN